MISYKGLASHLVLLGVAGTLAALVWTKEDAPRAAKEAAVEVWGGSPASFAELSFESADRKVSLEARKDSHGAWFVGKVDKTVKPPTPHPPVGDAGADAAPPPAPLPKTETVRFVGVGQAQKLVESLAPLMALRALGTIEPARAEEFGFDKPEGTLRVKIGGTQHVLELGGTTPGGGDRYARLGEGGAVFAIPGSVAQNLMFAESRLIERELHGFEDDEVQRLVVEKGDQRREFVRVDDKKEAWASADSPASQDETATNWVTKLGRLRISEYVENPSPAPGPSSLVVSVRYQGKGGRDLGQLELHKLAAPGQKPTFLAKSEHTRWFAEVLSSTAEQVEQDLPSVLK